MTVSSSLACQAVITRCEIPSCTRLFLIGMAALINCTVPRVTSFGELIGTA